MSIVFLVAFEENSYSGVVRPFVNWANKLKNNATVAVYKCSNQLKNYIRDMADLNGFIFESDESFQNLIRKIENNTIDFFFSDDYMPRLKLALDAKEYIDTKYAIYSQVLYGIHSIGNFHQDGLGVKTKIAFSVSSVFPFKLVSSTFKSMLKKVDFVIANSKLTAIMLNLLYGIEPAGVVFPPVDTDVFRPYNAMSQEKEVLLYLGSNAGDTDPNLCQRLVNALHDKVAKIHLLGNETFYRVCFKPGSKLIYHKGISDDELARIYSTTNLTMTPQTIEFFGLTPIESLACGTPVLAKYPHEALCEETVGQIAYSNKDFIKRAERLTSKPNKNIGRKCRETALKFSVENSISTLLRILENG